MAGCAPNSAKISSVMSETCESNADSLASASEAVKFRDCQSRVCADSFASSAASRSLRSSLPGVDSEQAGQQQEKRHLGVSENRGP